MLKFRKNGKARHQKGTRGRKANPLQEQGNELGADHASLHAQDSQEPTRSSITAAETPGEMPEVYEDQREPWWPTMEDAIGANKAAYEEYDQGPWAGIIGGYGRQSNILDPIHDGLDPSVWLHPGAPMPKLRPEHRSWIIETVFSTLEEHGYDGMEKWLSLIFTGSLTTYQYADRSDCDTSLFIESSVFPEWSRADMIGIMVANVDGTTLPGTSHPMQCFVVAKGIEKTDLYQPGLRSGYDVIEEQWVVPPDRARVHDVENEMHQAYTVALENADKMERLLKFEPQKAAMMYHQIHRRRMHDMQEGKGDYSPSNVTYKMLNNRGYFQRIHDLTGEYIA